MAGRSVGACASAFGSPLPIRLRGDGIRGLGRIDQTPFRRKKTAPEQRLPGKAVMLPAGGRKSAGVVAGLAVMRRMTSGDRWCRGKALRGTQGGWLRLVVPAVTDVAVRRWQARRGTAAC
jgi:hypothetical protein